MSTGSIQEVELRKQLENAVRRIRTSIERCPALDGLTPGQSALAAEVLADGCAALNEATALTGAISELEDLSEAGVVLVTSSRMALTVVRTTFALLTAELDMHYAA